ncbi:MAG: molybdenum cofactor biosysynthesis protein [Opitutales bacterium]|nr:molybdenum cofactor biosysynthesis protein [Opitutales bacterium]MCH8540515.1 molybdenum cofactor biosysynthesis protein [Opitutales bacterium]
MNTHKATPTPRRVRLREIFISPAHTYFGHHGKPPGTDPMVACEEVEAVAGKGLRGDRFFDYKPDYKGQVTFFSHEVHQDICSLFECPDLPVSVFRRNVILEGIDLNELIGRAFVLGGMKFYGVEECKPCYWMDRAIQPGAEEALRGRGGLRAKILQSGTLQAQTIYDLSLIAEPDQETDPTFSQAVS